MLGQLGFCLVLVGRTRGHLTETASLSGAAERTEVVGGDVSDPFTCRHMVARAVERFGRLDVLVNNAGLAPLEPIDRSTPEMIERVYRVNALGPAWAIHHAWPVFARQHAESKSTGAARAAVINISTIGTIDPFPGFFAYASAKAATNLMIASVAKEGAAIGVRGFAIAPGAVETPMLRALFSTDQLPASQCLGADEVARVVVDCARGARDSDNGRVIPLVPEAMRGWLAEWRAANPGGQLSCMD